MSDFAALLGIGFARAPEGQGPESFVDAMGQLTRATKQQGRATSTGRVPGSLVAPRLNGSGRCPGSLVGGAETKRLHNPWAPDVSGLIVLTS